MTFTRLANNRIPTAAALAATAVLVLAPALALADAGHGRGLAIGEPGKAAEATRIIDVVMRDNYFDPAQITVRKGETIRFRLVNKGSFLHEFGLGTAAMHEAHQRQMRVMMDHGMITAKGVNEKRMRMSHGPGGGTMAHDDPNSVLVEPGKSGELVWKFSKGAKLEFACNIPGHYESGMIIDIDFR